MYTCWACKGNKKCLQCHGSGYTYSERQSREIACPLCDGGGVCNVCHGSGQTSTQTPEEDMKRGGMGHLLDSQGKVDWNKMGDGVSRLRPISTREEQPTEVKEESGLAAGGCIGTVVGFLGGFISCWVTVVNDSPVGLQPAGRPFLGLIVGAVVGSLIGFVIKQANKN
jgi:hypothetical protein